MLPTLAIAFPAASAPEPHAPPRQPAAHPFAELLRQNQAPAPPQRAAAAPPAPQPHAPTASESGSDDREPTSEAENARPSDVQRDRKLAQRAPTHRRGDIPAERTAHPAEATPGEHAHGTDDRADGITSDACMATWPMDCRLTPADAATARSEAGGAEAAVDEQGSIGGSASGKRAGIQRDGADDRGSGLDEAGRLSAAVDERGGMQGFAVSGSGEPRVLAPSAGDPAPKAIGESASIGSTASTSPLLPTLASPLAGATASAAPLVAGMPTPFGSPDFAAAFGLQVSLLARDGHHQAELHLNPAEMGPVSVQIVVDGTQARIDFGADVAATRQAIEAGLPELASALRDAGLTLHGGGVSSHAGRERGERDGASDDRRSASTHTAPEARTRRVWRASPGGIDLYA